MKKITLSTKGKIGFLPSLIISVPVLLAVIVIGTVIFVAAKIFDAVGILDALEYQYKIFKKQRSKRRMI